MPPQTFQCDGVEWRKLKVLGKGSFGEAYLIETTSNSSHPKAQAVCKLVHLAAMKKDEQREALNEVRVLSQLKHPNIVQYMGSFQADGYLHILMEYCNAGDVDHLIKKRQSSNNKMLEEEVIASIFIQVCSALRYLHERRILHRDLKAQNIFLCQAEASRDGNPGKLVAKLGDFGISTVLRNTLALAKTVCGTPYYFSPELCLNRPYNNKSDVWSLGCILYEMASLKHAFDANNMKALMQRILTGKYAPIDAIYHRSLQDVIDGMLQQKVEKRMSIQQVQKTQFVVQHTERLYQQHELDSSLKRKERERVEAQRRASADEPNVRMVPGLRASPRPRNVDRDERAKAAMERRQDQEQQLIDRKHNIEDQRRRKNLRAAQHYDRHREHIREKMVELERLDDVRRRIEICSYEDQVKYTQQGWQLVKETKDRQQERSRGHEERDKKLQDLMEQMQAIDEKMQSRKLRREQQAPSSHVPEKNIAPLGLPPKPARAPTARELAQAYKNRVSAEAPWNRNRCVPVGFTQDSWDAHCQVMGHAIPVAVSPGPGSNAIPARREPLHAGESVAPPSKGQLSEVEASAILRVEQDRLARDPRFQEHQLAMEENRRKKQAQLEWEEHKKRIRASEALPHQQNAVPKPCGGVVSLPSDMPVFEEPPHVYPQAHNPSVPKPLKVDTSAGYRVDNGGRYREDAQVPFRPNPVQEGYEDDSCASDHSSATSSPRSHDSSSVASDASDSYSEVIDAMKEQYLRPNPPEMFEEAPLPVNDISRVANTIKFTLDGKTLQLDGVGISDPPRARVEALRVFLIDGLGGQRSLERLIRSLQDIQSADVDEALADAMLAKLEQQYGQKKSLVDLAIQLVVCEAMLDAQ